MSANIVKLEMSDGSPDIRVAFPIKDVEGNEVIVHFAVVTMDCAISLSRELNELVAWAEVQS